MAVDLETNRMVCMKIIKNDKDFLDQSLDEIKLLRLIQVRGDIGAKHCLTMNPISKPHHVCNAKQSF